MDKVIYRETEDGELIISVGSTFQRILNAIKGNFITVPLDFVEGWITDSIVTMIGFAIAAKLKKDIPEEEREIYLKWLKACTAYGELENTCKSAEEEQEILDTIRTAAANLIGNC